MAMSETQSTRFSEFQRAMSGRVLPLDLSHCMGRKTLVQIILAEVDHLPDSSDSGASAGSFSRKFLFTLLAYCYSIGAFGSVDIELAARNDPMVRYLCSGSIPDIDTIRLFRRLHHDKLVRLLTAVFRRVWELRFDEPAGGRLPVESYATASLRRWDRDSRMPDFDSEAVNRLARAVRADSMALDV
jgi:hypothetical protein